MQHQYEFWHNMADAYTHGPLLRDKSRRKVDDSLLHADLSISLEQPFYDSIMRNLGPLCEESELAAIQANPDYVKNPYPLQKTLEDKLLGKTDANMRDTFRRLEGKDVYLVVKNLDTWKRWEDEIKKVKPVGILVEDTSVGIMGNLEFRSFPLLDMEKALAENWLLPIVILACRKSVVKATRSVHHLLYPRKKADIIPCWR